MNRESVDTFEKLSGQLISVYEEISILSKKSPGDAVNKFKLRFINSLVKASNEFLSKKYKPLDDFEIFNEDDVPQNSDVVFILAQYIECFEKLRSDHVVVKNGAWHWRVLGTKKDETDPSGMIFIRTAKPKKLMD
jgi:hypothetical protein